MMGLQSKFAKLDESVTGEVSFGDGSSVTIKGKGYVVLSYWNSEERTLVRYILTPLFATIS